MMIVHRVCLLALTAFAMEDREAPPSLGQWILGRLGCLGRRPFGGQGRDAGSSPLPLLPLPQEIVDIIIRMTIKKGKDIEIPEAYFPAEHPKREGNQCPGTVRIHNNFFVSQDHSAEGWARWSRADQTLTVHYNHFPEFRSYALTRSEIGWPEQIERVDWDSFGTYDCHSWKIRPTYADDHPGRDDPARPTMIEFTPWHAYGELYARWLNTADPHFLAHQQLYGQPTLAEVH